MSKPSELSEFIKARLGRTSSKLVQSFKLFIQQTNYPDHMEYPMETAYQDWLPTVRQLPGKKKTREQIDLARLYRTVENLTKKLEEEKEKSGRLGERVIQLEKENAKLQAIKNGYIAPPTHVLRAMAVHGD